MIEVEGLRKTFASSDGRSEVAVAGISFEQKEGEFLTLLGPSGCGKTTTLRSIAGLETPDEGEIRIGDKVVFSSRERIDLSPARRKLGMVFQSYAVWPHMTVSNNVAYPLRFEKGLSRAEKRSRVEKVLEAVGLGPFAHRPAPALSGGQQQRVALARALVGEPEVLLLDEPLSNLDASLRKDLGNHIRDLQRRLGLTVIYVTHDQTEAMSMSDRIALMQDGHIVEQGAPEAIYQSPISDFAARFVGEANLLEATIVARHADGWEVDTPAGSLVVKPPSDPEQFPAETTFSVLLRPEGAELDPPADDMADWNMLEGRVEASRYFGFFWEFEVRLDSGELMKVKSLSSSRSGIGDRVRVAFHRTAALLVRRSDRPAAVPEEGSASSIDLPDVATR